MEAKQLTSVKSFIIIVNITSKLMIMSAQNHLLTSPIMAVLLLSVQAVTGVISLFIKYSEPQVAEVCI